MASMPNPAMAGRDGEPLSGRVRQRCTLSGPDLVALGPDPSAAGHGRSRRWAASATPDGLARPVMGSAGLSVFLLILFKEAG